MLAQITYLNTINKAVCYAAVFILDQYLWSAIYSSISTILMFSCLLVRLGVTVEVRFMSSTYIYALIAITYLLTTF